MELTKKKNSNLLLGNQPAMTGKARLKTSTGDSRPMGQSAENVKPLAIVLQRGQVKLGIFQTLSSTISFISRCSLAL
ncbi:uncharacterized protein G2W53_037149 [Senna tora]|uniref:Uncharacterized protein n=1 Tax=Senna tora TaxID=362788 RepID=A0A834SWR1_9FABA|nr:uncharacterized protein G2W53_037149 [Senna tora]